MEGWDGLNRRHFPRVSYPCLVVIRNEEQKGKADKNDAILTHTENVGVGGVCVVLRQDVKIFRPVELELDLLDLGENICCKGKVVWNIQRQGEAEVKPLFYDIGVEFVDIKADDQKRMKIIVERLVKNSA